MRTMTIEIKDEIAEQLEEEAKSLDLSVEQLISLRAEQLLSQPNTQFTTTASRIIREDRQLLERFHGGRATALASEATLAKIWDTPEEDEAWQDL